MQTDFNYFEMLRFEMSVNLVIMYADPTVETYILLSVM